MDAVRGALRDALDEVAGVGPFFAASANPAEVVDDSWRPLRELYADPQPLAARIAQVGRALGEPEPRVAASIAHQGLAARLVSPLIALASVHGLVPPWSPDTLHWRPSVTGPWPLWESAGDESTRRPGNAADLAAAVAEALVGPHLVALAAATRAAATRAAAPAGGAPSGKSLWGNAASSVVTAGRMVAAARPEAAERAREVVAGLLGTGPLAGAGTVRGAWGFRRRSCCLYYRVPGGGLCGDCVLTGDPRPADAR